MSRSLRYRGAPFERRMQSYLLTEGENTGLAVSVIVLVIVTCPLSSLKVLYYAMITPKSIVGGVVHK